MHKYNCVLSIILNILWILGECLINKVLNKSDSNGVLLWTNPNPTTTFSSQTITVDNLSNYKYLLIFGKNHINNSFPASFDLISGWNDMNQTTLIKVDHTGLVMMGGHFYQYGNDQYGNSVTGSRTVSSNSANNTITFGKGCENNTGGGAVNNNYGIPCLIYGLVDLLNM